jgi:outer membrane protein assembly factor BamB/PKD repeat protein
MVRCGLLFGFGLLLSLSLTCCSSRSISSRALTAPGAGPATGSAPAQRATWPTALPVDGVQPWEQLDEAGYVLPGSGEVGARAVTAIDADSEFVPGVERYSDGGAGVSDNGEACALTSGAAGAAELSWACYRLSLGGVQPGVVSADVNLLPAGGTRGYYIGLGDYSRETWDWSGPFSDSHVRLSTADDLAGGADLLSPLGNLFVCIAAFDGAQCDVIGVAANPLDTADATAPPVPDTPTLTPVDGGLLVEWLPVSAGDLAGYRIYYNSQWFLDMHGTGVQVVQSLQGLTNHLLAASDTIYLRLSAVDISGNESALSELASATPLGGAAPAASFTVSAPSGALHDVITISASGGETYDFDVDGDGLYDTTASAISTAEIDTGATGLIRPHVRAYTGGVMTAQGGVSVIVTGNTRPAVSATADPQTGAAPLTVTFSGEAQDSEDDASALTYAWDFNGDGTYEADTNTLTPDPYEYDTQGIYNAKLRVTDSEGAWAVDTVTVLVSAGSPVNNAPVAALSADKTSTYAPYTIKFNAGASTAGGDPGDSIVLYQWDFNGDGAFDASGSPATASYTYPVSGWYVASVTVTDSYGATDSADLDITLPSAWPMFGMDPQHHRRSPYVGAQTDNVKWTFTTGGAIRSSPAIGADGTIYVGSDDGRLYAIKPNGNLRWSYNLGDLVPSSPAIGSDGTVYIGCWNGNYYAINPNGTLKWTFPTGGAIGSSATVGPDGTIYCGSNDEHLYAINPDGSLKWSYAAGDAVYSVPAIAATGTIYIGSLTDGKLHAVRPDGSLKWTYTTGGWIDSSPAVASDGTVYVGSQDHLLYAVNPDGSLKWTFTTAGDIHSSPGIGLDGTIYIGSGDGNIYAINADGSNRWAYKTFAAFVSPTIGADGTVYAGCWLSRFALNADGSVLWSYSCSDDTESSPAIGMDGTVYFGGDSGDLYAFGS